MLFSVCSVPSVASVRSDNRQQRLYISRLPSIAFDIVNSSV